MSANARYGRARRLTDDVNEKLDKLLAAIEKENMEILSADEIAVFREIVEVEKSYPGSIRATSKIHHAIMATGFLADGIYSILRWVVGFAAVYVAFRAGAGDWLRAAILGGRP